MDVTNLMRDAPMMIMLMLIALALGLVGIAILTDKDRDNNKGDLNIEQTTKARAGKTPRNRKQVH